MIAVAKLSSPKLVVFYQGPDDDEPKPYDVQTLNPDLVAWDRTRAANRWPKAEESPMMWQTFIAWKAATRLGLTHVTWEAWADRHCLDVSLWEPPKPAPGDPAGELGGDVGDPSRGDLEPG